jgi:hypothetical protein
MATTIVRPKQVAAPIDALIALVVKATMVCVSKEQAAAIDKWKAKLGRSGAKVNADAIGTLMITLYDLDTKMVTLPPRNKLCQFAESLAAAFNWTPAI